MLGGGRSALPAHHDPLQLHQLSAAPVPGLRLPIRGEHSRPSIRALVGQRHSDSGPLRLVSTAGRKLFEGI